MHDKIFGIAEAILNTKRRQQRGEAIAFSDEEAEECAFFLYGPTYLDDRLRDGEISIPTEDIFEFTCEEQLPSSLAGILSPQRYLEVSTPPVTRKISESLQRKEKGKQKETQEEESETEEEQEKEKEKGKEKEKENGKKKDQRKRQNPFEFDGDGAPQRRIERPAKHKRKNNGVDNLNE